jgi:hypothetical protein
MLVPAGHGVHSADAASVENVPSPHTSQAIPCVLAPVAPDTDVPGGHFEHTADIDVFENVPDAHCWQAIPLEVAPVIPGTTDVPAGHTMQADAAGESAL